MYDDTTKTLHIRLEKAEAGQVFPNLDTLQPQLLSDEEMQQWEKDAAQQTEYAYGLEQTRAPMPRTLQAMADAGQLPYLDIVDPGSMTDAQRQAEADAKEVAKWDEGMYLDNYVDMDGEVAGVLRVMPTILTRTDLPAVPPRSSSSAAEVLSTQATALLVQLLFAYMYEMHVSYNDPSTESAWTLCKLCRSLCCSSDPQAAGTTLPTVVRACYRRALTYPLYRSWALCERVHADMVQCLRSEKVIERCLAILQEVDGMFALAPSGTGLSEQTELVLHTVWQWWIAPLQSWLPTTTAAHWAKVASQLSAPTKAEVGEPGGWDLEALELAAQAALAEGEGGYV